MRTFASLIVVVAVACGSHAAAPPPTSTTPPNASAPSLSTSIARLVDDLRAAGAIVDIPQAPVPLPVEATISSGGGCGLSGIVSQIVVDGETVNIHELPDDAQAHQAAATVGCSGDSIGDCILEWRSYPHFYRSGPLIIMHIGSHAVAATLTSVLGAPFAGEGSPCLAALHADAADAQRKLDSGDVGTIRGVALDDRGKRLDLLIVRASRPGWTTVERTGWAPYGKKRRRGEFIMSPVPSGTYRVDITRADDPTSVWTSTVTVSASKTTTVSPILHR